MCTSVIIDLVGFMEKIAHTAIKKLVGGVYMSRPRLVCLVRRLILVLGVDVLCQYYHGS